MKKFTKFLTLLLAVLMCFCVGACDSSGGESTAVIYKENFPDDLDKSFLITDKSQFRYDVTDPGERSLILFEELRKVYYRDGMAFPWRAGYYDDRLSNSFLWDFGALHSMANAVLRANPDNETAKYWLGEISDDLETYYNRFDTDRIADRSFWNKDLENNMFSEEFIDLAMRIMQIKGTEEADGKMRYRMPVRIYGSNTSGTDPYYDDNVWVVMSLFEAGEQLGRPEYIKRAEECMMYVLSGWDDAAGGGLRWKESHATKNTCSNGPAAMACMMFYNYYKSLTPENDEQKALYEDKQKFYLQFAKYIYEWTKSVLMDTSDGTYGDNIELKGDGSYTVNMGKLTYTTGTMLSAAIRIYEATLEPEYKADADKTIRGAYQTFVSRDRFYAPGIDLYPDSDGWFNVYLVQGYLDYARVFGNDAYLKKMRDVMDFAYKNARNYYGLIQNDWSGRDNSPDAHYNSQQLRNAAAPIEVTALVDAWFDAHPSEG